MPRSTLKLGSQSAQIEGQHTFRVSKSTTSVTTHKRSRFDPKRREEVKAVRYKRSCLRCALLKIKVSLIFLKLVEGLDACS